MSNKYVYVTSCSRNDLFGEMTAISMASLKAANPEAYIALLVDAESESTFGLQAACKMADDVIKVQSAFSTQVLRSRDLKVRLRSIVEGDLVFLDSDTFIMRDLSELFKLPADLASARDYESKQESPIQKPIWPETASLGWRFEPDHYQNSGVVFMRDNHKVHEFARIQQENWRNFVERIGKPNDQPAFKWSLRSATNSEIRLRHEVLAPKYNAQITGNPLLAIGAAIIHVYSGSFRGEPETVLHAEAVHLQKTGDIRLADVNDAIGKRRIWLRNDSKKKKFASVLNRVSQALSVG